MKDQYVLLTGGKNNAGDFLIKHRAKELLAWLRPDRSFVDMDAWKPLTQHQVDDINESKALILTGGPSVQYQMHPIIYPLVPDLSALRVPVVMLGVGWKAHSSSAAEVCNYELSPASQRLLRKTTEHTYPSAVRDYDTLSVLQRYGLDNVLMAGCPALYSVAHIGKPFRTERAIERVTFSMGVSFIESTEAESVTKALVTSLKDYFPNAAFTVAFHHSIDPKTFAHAYRGNTRFVERHVEIVRWLADMGIAYVDISGSESRMLEHYESCDLHVGYRVHAHILMSSVSKPSILLSEDSRSLSLKDVIGGLILEAHDFDGAPRSAARRLARAVLSRMDGKKKAQPGQVVKHVMDSLDYEVKNAYPRISQSRANIDRQFRVMQDFLRRLP